MSMLHVFDMDGTLLRGTTASMEIARKMGCLPELTRLESLFGCGAMTTRDFASSICRMWGTLTLSIVDEVFRGAPWIHGLPEVMRDIRARGERSLVVTMSPDFFAERLRSFGADEVVASRFPSLPFQEAPDPAGILCPADKVTAVDRALSRHGLRREQCIAYGDSHSDAPLFDVLPHTVAINADAYLRARARLQYEGSDLREAYGMARRRLVDERHAEEEPPADRRETR
ncbi:HAD-IB family phosphatase [Polyangium sp. 6x1]|uniref:HAD family hydrolase n=1 Tax=Polyangium sp. 6x1 TaxID=3042689 RepID=UPI002482F2D8|nr:HAD-IB family phosphatase [Polyangium sp. 6x1]MDI1449753.1 HAD-IB family phosphatase [Polyangium sp. 6x1]